MPVGIDSLEVKKQIGIPNGASPTGEYCEIPTDEENVYSDNEQPKVAKNKGLAVPSDDDGGITDSEDVVGSDNEDEFFKEKVKNRPTLQELGILSENPTTETINLTEGYAPEAGPVLSASEDENDERMQSRHKKNVKTMAKCQQMLGVQKDLDEGTTDVEDMEGDGDEIQYRFRDDDSLPAHYMHTDDGTIESKEKMTQVMAVPKAIPRVMVKHTPASSDDDEDQPRQQKRRPKGRSQLAIASGDESGHTDVEDLQMGGSPKGAPEIKITPGKEIQGNVKSESCGRIKKRKHKKSDKKQPSKPASSLVAPGAEDEGVTDVEELSGTCTESDSDLDADIYGLTPPVRHVDGMTDTEDIDASDDEGLIAPPIKKAEPFIIPEVHQEKLHIRDIQDKPKEEKGRDTDEDDFELDEKEDNKPLSSRKNVEVQVIKKSYLEPDECDEAALTDMEDMDMDEKAENELLEDYISRVPKETDILPCLKEMEGSIGNISKTETMRDIATTKQNELDERLTFQEALETLTDVEDLDEDFGKPKVQQKKKKSKKHRKNNETDEESMNESDFEEEPHAAPSKKKKGKRLPLVSQLSEVRFVETKTGPLSIIVTPDVLEKNPEHKIENQVSGVLFLEEEEEGAFTDFEELSGDEDKSKRNMKVPYDSQQPLTDTEDFEGEVGDLERPPTPLPSEREYSVLRSPKRELIRIKEDKHGVPQVTIEKLKDNMLTISDAEDTGLTDTEDMDVTQDEADQFMGRHTKRAEFEYEFPDGGTTEFKTKIVKNKQAKSGLHIDSGNEEGHTDVEELSMPKKGRKKSKGRDRLQPSGGGDTDGHTDVEYLSDQDGKSVKIQVSAASDNEHTDLDDLEGEPEDIHPSREDCATPDVIHRAAVKKILIIKEGPHGTTKTEHQEMAANCGLGVPDDDIQGVTDTSDMEASGGEEEEIEHPEVDLPEYSSDVVISEKNCIPVKDGESKQIKDNLLLPEDNVNDLTDVESIGEGEGTHESTSQSQQVEEQPSALSRDQAECSSGVQQEVTLSSDETGSQITPENILFKTLMVNNKYSSQKDHSISDTNNHDTFFTDQQREREKATTLHELSPSITDHIHTNGNNTHLSSKGPKILDHNNSFSNSKYEGNMDIQNMGSDFNNHILTSIDSQDTNKQQYNRLAELSENCQELGPGNKNESVNSESEGLVVRRLSGRSGPRPITFPLCLLQPEATTSPEAREYFRQQQEMLEEMGRQGLMQMDVADLTALTLPENLIAESDFESEDIEETTYPPDCRRKQRKLIKSSSSYENLYDGADLKSASDDIAPDTDKLAEALGDPFNTKTMLPPEMCSSFENIYMKSDSSESIKFGHEQANILAGEILESAIHEAAQEGTDLPVGTPNVAVSIDDDATVKSVATDIVATAITAGMQRLASQEEFGTASTAGTVCSRGSCYILNHCRHVDRTNGLVSLLKCVRCHL